MAAATLASDGMGTGSPARGGRASSPAVAAPRETAAVLSKVWEHSLPLAYRNFMGGTLSQGVVLLSPRTYRSVRSTL